MRKLLFTLTTAITLIALLTVGFAPMAIGESGGEMMTVSIMAQEGSSVTSEQMVEYPTYQALIELFHESNLDLEYVIVAREQYLTTIQTQLAAGINLPDIVSIGVLDNTTALNLGYQGIIQDVVPLIEQHSDGRIQDFLDDYAFARKETIAPNGASYWFVGVSRFEIESQPGKLAYSTLAQQHRLDWREKLGIDEPNTIDEFRDMLLAFRENDINGDGLTNEIMLVDISIFANGIAQWFGLGMDLTYADHNTNQVVSPWLQPGIEAYITFMQQLVQDGIIDLQMVGASTEMNNQKLYSNCVSSRYTYTLTSPETSMTDIEGVKYTATNPLQALDGVTPAVVGEISEITLSKYAITKSCRDVEAAIRYFDVAYSKPYCELMAWGREGYEFEYRDDGAKHLTAEYGTFDRSAGSENKLISARYFPEVFLRTQNLNLESQLDNREEYKNEWQVKYNDYSPMYYQGSNFYALPDEATAQRKAEALTNLNTYSQESITKLCSGEISIDQLPSIVDELKRLGLEELVAINQALFDQYNAY